MSVNLFCLFSSSWPSCWLYRDESILDGVTLACLQVSLEFQSDAVEHSNILVAELFCHASQH
jgi:hypothetical protein